MAYQLEYGFQKLRKNKLTKGRQLNYVIVSLILTAVIVCTRFGSTAINWFFVDNKREYTAAASKMVTNLREGMELDEAVYVFCEEIVNKQDNDYH